MLNSKSSLAIQSIADRLRSGDLRPAELVAGVLERIEQRGDDKVWIHRLPRAELMARALTGVQPAYAASFDTPSGAIASLSPELFLRRVGDEIVTAPIKGTAPRDADPALAAAALAQLEHSSKDAAEHVMIVDLMRNDLGRVSAYGTVTAPRHPTAEAHPGVVNCGRGALHIFASSQPYEPISQILALEEKKYEKNDNDAGRRERRHQRSQHCHEFLRRCRVGLMHFHRNG